MNKLVIAVAISLITAAACSANAAEEKWVHTLGTGLFGLNIDGDLGFGTRFGPVKADASMNFSEVRDVLENAYGFGGASTKGPWTIVYKYAHLKFEGNETVSLPADDMAKITISMEVDTGEVAGVYSFAESNGHHWGALAGVRFVDQSLKSKMSVAGTSASINKGDDWVDVIVGITHALPLSQKLIWTNRFDVGFGGSDGTYHVNSGLAWQFGESWSAVFFADYIKHDFDSGSKSSLNWYLYDAAEYGLGANIMYRF